MLKGNAKRNIEEKKRKLNDRQLEFFDEFVFTGRLKSKFNNSKIKISISQKLRFHIIIKCFN